MKVRKQRCSSFRCNLRPRPRRRPRNGFRTSVEWLGLLRPLRARGGLFFMALSFPCPSGEKPLDVVQDQLMVIGLREDRAVLTKLTRSMGCALRSTRKDNVQLRAH